MTTEKIWSTVGGTAAVLVLGSIILGITNCTRRNWEFEDACRRAGGVTVEAGALAHSNTRGEWAGSATCVRLEQAATLQPIPLADFRR